MAGKGARGARRGWRCVSPNPIAGKGARGARRGVVVYHRIWLRGKGPGGGEGGGVVYHGIRLRVKGPGVRDGVGVVYHRIRLRVKGPGAEESAPYACVSIRRNILDMAVGDRFDQRSSSSPWLVHAEILFARASALASVRLCAAWGVFRDHGLARARSDIWRADVTWNRAHACRTRC